MSELPPLCFICTARASIREHSSGRSYCFEHFVATADLRALDDLSDFVQ